MRSKRSVHVKSFCTLSSVFASFELILMSWHASDTVKTKSWMKCDSMGEMYGRVNRSFCLFFEKWIFQPLSVQFNSPSVQHRIQTTFYGKFSVKHHQFINGLHGNIPAQLSMCAHIQAPTFVSLELAIYFISHEMTNSTKTTRYIFICYT